ncbi:MAG: hypothetical protein M1822_006581 [Bathelium mastoideum]|nr:MAG: hypothetical protein M1822_006581 [Bathelium mastoideum]
MRQAIDEALDELGIVETPQQDGMSGNDKCELVRVSETEDKGLGIFAIRDIPKGTRILSESPLLELPPPGMGQPDWARVVMDRFEALSVEKQNTFMSLHCQMQRFLLQRIIVEAILSGDIAPEDIRITGISDVQDIANDRLKRKTRVAGTFQTNSFGLCGENDHSAHVALFEYASRINHSCMPNAWHSWNHETGKHNIQTIRDVAAGEEITTEYTDSLDIRANRQKILKLYGFECRCEACSNSEAELRRVKIQRLKNEEFGQFKQQLDAGGNMTDLEIHKALETVKDLLMSFGEEACAGIHEEEM